MREFLEFVIRQLIEFPDDMVLTEIPSGRTTVFKLQLRQGDVGRIIGRGGQTIQADAPLNHIPLYVKEGSIIPAGPEMEYTLEKAADPITLYVFTGKDAHFDLYEDENTNYNYENGKYATISFDYEEATGRLTIRDRKGSFENMLEERDFQIVSFKVEGKDNLVGVSLTAHPDRVVHYQGKEVTVNLNEK